MKRFYVRQGELIGQLELQFAQESLERTDLDSKALVNIPSNVFELRFSAAQRLINSMPGIQSVLKRAERLDW